MCHPQCVCVCVCETNVQMLLRLAALLWKTQGAVLGWGLRCPNPCAGAQVVKGTSLEFPIQQGVSVHFPSDEMPHVS